jgi:phosphatidylglycerol:prolipoprotein diacylglycerol transferase
VAALCAVAAIGDNRATFAYRPGMPYFHDINPYAVQLPPFTLFGHEFGSFGVHWYGLMYLGAFVAAWILGKRRLRAGRLGAVNEEQFGDLMFYGMLGVILGGRIGYMLFYGTSQLLAEPLSLLRVWEGGMSFHGGLLGVLAAGLYWSRKNKVHFFDTVDFVAPMVPIGLGLGRLGNYIGGELWGKHTDAAWGVIFPRALETLDKTREQLQTMYLSGALNGEARHPSQLYEAFLEGVVLFTVVWLFSAKPRPRYAVSGVFALLYGMFRFAIEFVREPDAQLGYLAFGWVTMGQVLSLPLIVLGLWWLWLSRR